MSKRSLLYLFKKEKYIYDDAELPQFSSLLMVTAHNFLHEVSLPAPGELADTFLNSHPNSGHCDQYFMLDLQ